MTGLSHIGIATSNIEETIENWIVLGFELIYTGEVSDQKVKVAKLKYGDLIIEFLEPTSKDSPIQAFIDKRGPGIHHLSIEVEDVVKKIDNLTNCCFRMIDKTPRIGAAGKLIAFIHPVSTGGVLVELEQD